MANKVFVGNLSFKVRDTDLKAFFEPCGKVTNATIIYRGPRSLGFGFVEFETPEAMNNAVATMHHKELYGMQINVEVARPPPARAQPQATTSTAGGAPVNAPMMPRGPRRPRGPRFPGGPRGFFNPMMMQGYPPPPFMGAGQPPQQQQQPMMNMNMNMGPYGMPMMPPPQRFPRGPRMPRGPRPPMEPKQPVPNAMLFVANLPFVVTDANLKEIFSDLHVKDAHVVVSPSGRSRGYGFVEFESIEARDKALQTLDKVEVEGRVLIIKAAMSPPNNMQQRRTPAPVATTPAATTATAPAPVAKQ